MIEKFENKVREIKNKTDKKIKVIIVVLILGVLVILSLNMTKLYNVNNQKLEDSYNNAMYQLIDYTNNIEVLLSKARITKSKKQSVIIYTDILKQSNLASSTLFLLPVDQNKLQNVAKFFTQTSGYALSLTNKILLEENLSDENYNDLKKLNNYASNLVEVLQKIYNNLNDGSLKWDELSKVADKELSEERLSLQMQNVRKISDAFTKYEGLIYDGAFSEHIENIRPKMLRGKNITVEDAKRKIEKIVNNRTSDKRAKKTITNISYDGETKGKIELYNFTVLLKGETEKINIQITKDTGLLYLMIYDRKVKKQNIDYKKAREIGISYLKNIGIDNMISTYYTIQDNMITINYAYTENDVVIYPDLIKVKIAMDTGEICSVETKGYIYNHSIRKELVPKISEEVAKKTINKNLKISNVRLSLILSESNKEILTYEYKGEIDKKVFLIYINAISGVEENVLLVIDQKNGVFTM